MTRTLAIFGISGRTGGEIARVAALRGWEVRGLVRATSRVKEGMSDYQIVRGSFAELDRVSETIGTSEAVCCVIGPRAPYTEAFCANATTAIITAMVRTDCRRLVCQTGAMIGFAPNRSRPMEWLARTFARRQPEVARDREEQERLVESSNLEWTIVKPPRLTDSPARERVEGSPTLRMGLMSRISRADLAGFILDEVRTGRFTRQRVFVRG